MVGGVSHIKITETDERWSEDGGRRQGNQTFAGIIGDRDPAGCNIVFVGGVWDVAERDATWEAVTKLKFGHLGSWILDRVSSIEYRVLQEDRLVRETGRVW